MYCGIDLDTLLPVYLIARIKRKPCVYDAHEYFTELPEIIDRPLIRKFWIRLAALLLPRIPYNYTVGASIAKELATKYGQPYIVIRNVPYLTEVRSEPASAEPYILYQGALNKGRGLEPLMLAMKDIPAKLYIAGEGDLSAELRAFATALPFKEKIRFLGYLRPHELLRFTRQAVMGINLVENTGLSYFYSLSNKFFDYIHAGRPQVSMNFPEYAILNETYEVAVLIDDLQPATIAAAIERLMNDKELYERIQKNTVKARQELNWQEESKQLIEFYNSIGK
jgi:glycosyltransferase involved in cell wall biosynthesis